MEVFDLSERYNPEDMERQFRRRGETTYIRNLGSGGVVTYQLDDAGGHHNAASWQVNSGTSGYETFEARREKMCRDMDEAIQWLREHFDEPVSVRESAQPWDA